MVIFSGISKREPGEIGWCSGRAVTLLQIYTGQGLQFAQLRIIVILGLQV